jgi:c-di-GMP-binding flagellar brake protein YcgR
MKDERRKSIRIPIEVTIRVVNEGKDYPATALNISADGISLKTTHVFHENELIEIIFPVPNSTYKLRLPARIVWGNRIEQDEEALRQIGMEFEQLPEADQKAVLDLINRLMRSGV